MENQVVVQSATEFTVGSVLSRTMSTLFKNPVLFIGLAFIALIPGIILTIILPQTQGANILTNLINSIFALVIQGAIAYGVFLVLRNEKASFGAVISRGLSSVVTLVLVSIIMTVLIFIGVMIVFIPGIIVACILAVSIPVCG